MKEFTEFRIALQESVEDLDEQVAPGTKMPPNILILKRVTVRQFPGTMVALYHNDRLGLSFSIPYGEDPSEPIINPVPLKEEHRIGDEVHYGSPSTGTFKRGVIVKVEPEHVVVKRGKYPYRVKKTSIVHKTPMKESVDVLTEDVISHLHNVKAFKTSEPLRHNDGTHTTVDPTTASMLLKVHGALHPDNQKKFAAQLEHSQHRFGKMLDFGWKQVK